MNDHQQITSLVLDKIKTIGKPLKLKTGEALVRQGDTSDSAFYLEAGSIIVTHGSSDNFTKLATLQAPLIIGEIGAFSGLPRTANMVAEIDSYLYRLEKHELFDLGREFPDLILNSFHHMGQLISTANQTLALYTKALKALDERQLTNDILDKLNNPLPELTEFADAFRNFAKQIKLRWQQHDEMESASIIQQSFLPKQSVKDHINRLVEIEAYMRPARQVGGDFYDYFMIDEDRLAILVGDVCGKGFPASIFMSSTVTAIRLMTQQGFEVSKVIAQANYFLGQDNDNTMFATAFYGILDIKTGILEYCNCGHVAPILLQKNGSIKFLKSTGLPLGMLADKSAKVEYINILADEELFIFSDGITEAMNSAEKQYGKDTLISLIKNNKLLPVKQLINLLLIDVDDFASGEEQSDDITILGLRMR